MLGSTEFGRAGSWLGCAQDSSWVCGNARASLILRELCKIHGTGDLTPGWG